MFREIFFGCQTINCLSTGMCCVDWGRFAREGLAGRVWLEGFGWKGLAGRVWLPEPDRTPCKGWFAMGILSREGAFLFACLTERGIILFLIYSDIGI
ncbi:hypothetical protein GCM10008938_31060 [Deinococcus roseus]|uniref:Uncharacterized protein n=1 Tax=Deinococcus roseus TaxID=392414 RepID=A0ABQ2D262_9DEIO|nr:hypothetical protein GCM10008938_31060 [Deinococcus roseus]